MDGYGTFFTHAQSCDNVRVQNASQWTALKTYFTHVQTCDNVRDQSATQWTVSVHNAKHVNFGLSVLGRRE